MSTKIAWTQETWNPIIGCTPVSPGCEHCYAARLAHRGLTESHRGLTHMTEHGPKWTGEVRCLPERLDQPLHWRKPRRIFVCSMSDLFHEKVPRSYITRVFQMMGSASRHTFQLLTKRADWMQKLLNSPKFQGEITKLRDDDGDGYLNWPLPNVWLGVTAENQEAADERIPLLLQTPAAVRFVSCEPLLGPIDFYGSGSRGAEDGDPCWLFTSLEGFDGSDPPIPGLDWCIVGGESGPGARPMEEDWVRSVRDQCVRARVAFFYKQRMIGRKTISMPELDGRVWSDYPR